MTFSKNFKLQVQALQPTAKNRLVYGLLDVASKEQFDLPTFKEIITELNREYETTESKLQNLKTDISETVVKDVLAAKIASQEIIEYVCDKLGNIFKTNPNAPEIIQLEGIILNNLARLTKYANDIISQEIYLEDLMRNKSFLERIRDSTTIKKIVITLALITAFKGQSLKPFDASSYNTKNYTIEASKPIETAAKTLNIPKAPEGYVYWKTVKALVTAYTPTGKGLMPGAYNKGKKNERPHVETGLTSTGKNALNDFTGIAVDPKLIPYGSMAYIDSTSNNKPVGWKIADDTGGNIRKNGKAGIFHLDVRMKNYNDAKNFGIKDSVMVHLFIKKDKI